MLSVWLDDDDGDDKYTLELWTQKVHFLNFYVFSSIFKQLCGKSGQSSIWNDLCDMFLLCETKTLKNVRTHNIQTIWLVGWVQWHINLCRLFNAKACLHIYTVCKHIIWWYHTKTKQLIYSHTSKYFQVFLYGISLFSDDSFVFWLFLTTISTNTNIMVFLFSNDLLSVDWFVVFSGL